MENKLNFIRKLKYLFFKYKGHKLFGPFSKGFILFGEMINLSRFINSNNKIPFNDFPGGKFDYTKRYILYEKLFAIENLFSAIDYIEFGVANGNSFKHWVETNKHPDSRFYGFDTFEGLPENWGFFKAGDMTTDGKFPDIKDSRSVFIKGLFQDTLPEFVKTYDNTKRKLIHMDADLYTSTLYALTYLAPYLKKGDLIVFDEFAVPCHEYLAFRNFVDSYRINFEVLVATNNFFFLAVKIL